MTSSLSFFEHNLQKSIISRGTIKTSQFDLNKACSMVVLLSWRLHRYPLKQLSLECRKTCNQGNYSGKVITQIIQLTNQNVNSTQKHVTGAKRGNVRAN